MAVVKVDVKTGGRQIKQSYTGTSRTYISIQGENIKKTTTPIVKTSGQITYVALVDDPKAQPIALLADRRLPQCGDVYVENGVVFSGVYYSDAAPRYVAPRGRFYEWEITYTIGGEFSNATQTTGGSNAEPDATPEPETLLTFSTSMELEDYATAADLDGAWNCNSIGEWFADPLIIKTGVLNLNYSRKERVNPLHTARAYFQAVNATEHWGFAPQTLKMADITFTATETTAGTSYDVNYKIQYRPRGWTVQKANAGLYYASGGQYVRALNEDGSPTDQPVLLALNGGKLAPGAPVAFKTFRVNPLADFSELGLPNPFEI